ncbi:hypothetical protein IAT40_005715 [Kwoniella sp. CBS 6097]
MQLQNASKAGYGYVQPLSENATWVYPLIPGEPPNVILYEFAACVPSNVTLAQICCSAVNGTFVTDQLSNRRTLNETEVKAVLDARYPGQNQTSSATYITGNVTETDSPGEAGAINWCSVAYNPLSDTPLEGVGFSSGIGQLGNVPESMNSWMACFRSNVPEDAINKTEAAYACVTRDVVGGGVIEGFPRYVKNQSGAEIRASVWVSGTILISLVLAVMSTF